MKTVFYAAAMMLTGIVVPAAAQAQYVGPSETHASTVAAVLESAEDDQYVVLTGRIVKQVGEEKYLFADDSGEIRAEIDKDKFTATIAADTLVELRGEVEKDFMESPEIDVDAIVVRGAE